jgi:hypothetical protein
MEAIEEISIMAVAHWQLILIIGNRYVSISLSNLLHAKHNNSYTISA